MPSEGIIHLISEYGDANYCTVRDFLGRAGLPVSLESCVNCNGSSRMCRNKLTLLESRYQDRLLLQIKEIEMIKYSASTLEGRDVGWEYAVDEWLAKFAPEFRKLNDKEKVDGKTVIEKFKQTLKSYYPNISDQVFNEPVLV
jgi:hypothetical protein